MYRMIIVDDDEVICKGLCHSVQWSKNEVEVVGTAYDGEAGLALIKTLLPDIALIDINLPFLDGLELSGIIRQEYPEIKVILLTAYEEFEFAKKAVKMHVHDYITKPFDNQKVVEAVCSAKERLIEERKLRNEIKAGLPLLKEKYLYELVTRSLTPEKEAEIRSFVGLPLENYFGVAILSIKSYFLNSAVSAVSEISSIIINKQFMKQKIFSAVQGLLDISKTVIFNSRDDEIAVIFNDFPQKEACEQYMLEIANEIRTRINTMDEFFLTLCVGTAYWGFHDIAKSYEEAKMAAEYSRYFENRSIIRINDIDSGQKRLDLNISDKQKDLVNCLKLGQFEEISNKIEQIFLSFKNIKGIYFSYIQLVAVETIILACKIIEEEENDSSKIINLSNKIIPQVTRMESVAEIEKWLKSTLTEVVAILSEKRKSGAEKIIDNAIFYIENHYMTPDLTLDDVAGFVHLSPNYFSSLFRQLKKINFSDYLEDMRIKKAVELFNSTELKIYEVAYKVGYNSPQYFSICFKKTTNYTPSEFKIKKN